MGTKKISFIGFLFFLKIATVSDWFIDWAKSGYSEALFYIFESSKMKKIVEHPNNGVQICSLASCVSWQGETNHVFQLTTEMRALGRVIGCLFCIYILSQYYF